MTDVDNGVSVTGETPQRHARSKVAAERALTVASGTVAPKTSRHHPTARQRVRRVLVPHLDGGPDLAHRHPDPADLVAEPQKAPRRGGNGCRAHDPRPCHGRSAAMSSVDRCATWLARVRRRGVSSRVRPSASWCRRRRSTGDSSPRGVGVGALQDPARRAASAGSLSSNGTLIVLWTNVTWLDRSAAPERRAPCAPARRGARRHR